MKLHGTNRGRDRKQGSVAVIFYEIACKTYNWFKSNDALSGCQRMPIAAQMRQAVLIKIPGPRQSKS